MLVVPESTASTPRDALREGVLEGLVGRISTVATSVPSLKAATLLNDILPGARTHPIHVAVGAASAEAPAPKAPVSHSARIPRPTRGRRG